MAQNLHTPTGNERFDHYWPSPEYRRPSRHTRLANLVEDFRMFFEDDSSIGYDTTQFAAAAEGRMTVQRDGDPVPQLKCALDFVYVWLVEGPGALLCPTYGEYLLFIIALSEMARYQPFPMMLRHPAEYTGGSDDGFDLFYWGERPTEADNPEALRSSTHFWSSRHQFAEDYEDLGHLPFGWEGFSHPAVDRGVYETARSRALGHLAEAR